MENLMMLTCSKKTNKRIISIILTVCFALVIAFCPIAQTVAYANVVNQCFEVVGFIVGTVAAYYTTSACLAAAGITTAVLLTGTIQAFVALLIAMGIGICVGKIVAILTSEVMLDAFGVEFWKALSNAWDQTTNKIKIAAGTFLFLYNRVKSVFNIKESHVNKFTTFPYVESEEAVTEKSVISDHPGQYFTKTYTTDDGVTKECTHFIPTGDFICAQTPECSICGKLYDSSSAVIENKYTFSLDIKNKRCDINFSDADYYFYFVNTRSGGYGHLITIPYVYNKRLYFAYCAYPAPLTYCNINNIGFNGKPIASSNNGVFYKPNGVNTYLFTLYDDGYVEKVNTIEEFLYNVFIKGGCVVSSQQKLSVSSITTDKLSDTFKSTATVLGSIDGSIPKDSDITTYKPMNKDITYNTKANDTAKTVVGKLTGVDVKSGDVVIDATEVKDIAIDDSTDIADSLTVTDVAAQDIVTDDTITDTDTPSSSLTDILNAPFVPWSTSIDLIKNASSGITERFPFCIPGYLKYQLNILVCDPKEPIFVIPFRIESADLGGDVKIDLTRFSSMTKITDFFLIAMLIVGLALSTKKLMF